MRNLIGLLLVLVMLPSAVCADGITNVLDSYYKPQTEFADLDSVPWAEEAIKELAEYGVVHSNFGRVEPNRYITRKEFVEIIVGVFGLYDFEAKCKFIDVDKSSFYYPYIAAAYSLGIINGANEFKFEPDKPLKRQDLAVIIYRAAEKCGIDLTKKEELRFTDNAEIDNYAIEAVSALKASKAVSGDENNCFNPHNYATFAEACKIVYYLM